MNNNINIVDTATKQSPKSFFYNHAFKFALIALFINIIVTIISQFVNESEIENKQIFTISIGLSSIVISTVLIYFLLSNYRNTYLDGYMSFGEGFKLGFIYTIIFSILITIFSFIYLNFIIDYDATVSAQLDQTIASLKKQKMSDEQIAKTIEMTKKFMTPTSAITIGLISNIVIQTIITLILSAILKKEIKHD